MKSKLFVLFTFMVASCTSVFASFNVSNGDTIQASTSDSSISNGNKHKVEFIYDGIVKKTMYVEDGTTLTSKDAPYEYSWYDSDNNGVVENFVDWEYNGDSLTNHIVVNSDIVVTGTQQDVNNFIKAVTSELPNNRPTHKQVSGSYGTAEYNDYFEEASISSVVLPNSITAYACNTYGGTNNNSSDWVTNVSADDLNSTVIFNYEFSSGLKEPSSSAIHVGLGEETSVSGYENYLSDFCNATYKLTNDVYLLDLVEGDNGISITLGAVTGYAGNKKDKNWIGIQDAMPQRFYQGIILKNYTSLDLNGYDLIAGPNTTLDAWGYVTDSVGTGTIVLESGSTMYTPFVVEDHYREDHMPTAYIYNANPFYMYRCPYIDCNLRIKVGANFNGKYRLAFGKDVFISGDFQLFGSGTGSDSSRNLFQIDAKDSNLEAYVERKVVDNSSLFGGNSMNTMIKSNWAYKKVELSFYNLDVTFNKFNDLWTDEDGINIKISGQSFKINTDKYPFVLSPYYNLYFYNCSVYLNQLIIVLPSSYIYFDKSSSLNLGYSTVKTMSRISLYADPQEYQSVGGVFLMDYFDINALNYFSKYKVNESAPSTTYIFNENKTYFTCINKNPARCDFYGKINFEKNSSDVSQYHPFTLAGNMNIYYLDSFKESIEKAQKSGLDVELSANYFFTSSNNFVRSLLPSVTLNIVFFDNSPLISNGYVLTPVDSDEVLNDKRMTYDKTSKLIKYVDGTTTTYYGYKLADDTSMANSYKMSNLNGTDSLAGTYTKLDSYSNGVAKFSSSSYINLSGVFLPFNDNGQVNVRKLAEGSGVSGDRYFNCTYNNGVWALA